MERDLLASPKSYHIQKTLRRTICFQGVGLHTGVQSKMKLVPAPVNHGIVFVRTDLEGAPKIPAHFNFVTTTTMATTLGLPVNMSCKVSTVEHLLAALYAVGITNLTIEINGPEIPILDGSAAPFLEAIWDTGIDWQSYSNRVMRVKKPIKVYHSGTVCELLPRDRLRLTTSIDFAHPLIGVQVYALELTPRDFDLHVGRARTFGFLRDLDKLRSHQLALGASVENVLAFSDDGVLNEEGMRFADECVRHKLLDALGDMSLCGCWIEGEMVSFRGGHSIHLALLKALSASPTSWEMIPAEPLTPVVARDNNAYMATPPFTH